MLTVPAYKQIEGVTLYSDDTYFYKFYPIAPAPDIRLDKNGKPIFLLVKYAFSDEDRLNDPALPAGGGYLNFDIQFDVPADKLAFIRQQLQADVDIRWEQLKNGAAAEQAMPGVTGTTAPPKVELGTPTWTSGKVAMDAPQAKELVTARMAEAEPSLLAGNIAVFNMDLSQAGATFMQKTLMDHNGLGDTDLTPIQVRYDLTFWARLPAVQIHITADSEKVYQYIHKLMEGRGTDYCSTYDYEHTVIENETLHMSGAINVQIDTGSGSVPEGVIDELREYAIDLVKQMIDSKFFTDEPPAHPDAGDSNPSVQPGGGKKKYLKETFDQTTMNLEVHLEQRSVVEWSIHPQTTLETFFKGMSRQEIEQFVRTLDLEDDFFKNLNLKVRAFTDFEDPEISNVEVQVRYSGRDENGEPREKNQSFTFTNSEPQSWSVSLIGSKREYQYRYRVNYKNREPDPFNDKWEDYSFSDLNIPAINPGRLNLNVEAFDVDFENLVSQVQVQLAYADEELGVPREESTVLLLPTRQQEQYRRLIYKEKRKDIEYKTRFRMKSGEVREDPEWKKVSGSQLRINQPFTDMLRISLLPTGDGWDDIAVVVVEMKYEDARNAHQVQDRFDLKSRDEFKTWKIYLRDKNVRDFQYRQLASYKNGHLIDSGWKSSIDLGEDVSTVPIPVERQGIRVMIMPETLNLNSAPLTEVTLCYEATSPAIQETFAFRDKTAQVWNIDVPPDSPVNFKYRVTHHLANGGSISLPSPSSYYEESDDVLVLSPYQAPEPGMLKVQVLATLVDFAVTPLVTLDMIYDDDVNNVHKVGSLTFTGESMMQSWEIEVKDVNARKFSFLITYYTGDGAPHSQAPRSDTVPRIVIPKFVQA